MSVIRHMLTVKAIAVVALVGFAASEAGTSLTEAQAMQSGSSAHQTGTYVGPAHFSLIRMDSHGSEYVEDYNLTFSDCLDLFYENEDGVSADGSPEHYACELQPDGVIPA